MKSGRRPVRPARALLALACVAAIATTQAAVPVAQQILRQGTPHDALFSVDFDADTGFAVGAAGQILRSDDAGRAWVTESSPALMTLLGVATAGGQAVAVGQMGTILRRDEGQWQPAPSDTAERLFDVDMSPQGRAVAVGAFGVVLRSIDGGQHWVPLDPQWDDWFGDPDGRLGGFFEPSLYGVQITDAGTIYVCGELSLIMRSRDGGEVWEVLQAGANSSTGVSPTLSAIRMSETGLGFAVGQEGTVLRTRDGGDSWHPLDVGTHVNLLGVDVDADGRVLISGMRAMFLSDNSGDDWQPVRSDDVDRGWYSEVALTGNGPIAVGHQGQVMTLGSRQSLSMAASGE